MQVVTIAKNKANTAWMVIGCPMPNDGRMNILTMTNTRKQAREWATSHGFAF